jgi:hypothetical protein
MILLIIVLCIREIQTGFCAEHIDVFWQMVEDSRKERDPNSIVSKLNYVTYYYPAGTIQTKGSLLERVTETSRKMAVQLIIEELKRKTGEDLGYDAKVWIDRYRGGLK